MKCPWCGKWFQHPGWQHPDGELQCLFYETAKSFEEPEACSEDCWRYFMEESYSHWNP